MIRLLPSHDETLVLPLSAGEVFRRLSMAIKNDPASFTDKSILFSGWIRHDRFRISLKVTRPNSYIALIKGRIEPTSSGCLIFLDYQLFNTTKLFLTFWLLFTCLFTTGVSFQYKSIGYALTGLVIAVGMYWITWSNFRMQLNTTRECLQKILS